MKKTVILTLLALASTLTAKSSVDLSGEWRFALDPQDSGIAAPKEKAALSDSVQLPGSITSQGFGEAPSMKTEWTGDGWRCPEMFKEWQSDDNFKFPFFLQPPKVYVGPAWYQRDFDWPGGPALLHLERVHWQSTVWLDGKMIGRDDSLGTPHEFDLGDLPAGKHTITLRIDNRLAPVNVGPLSHSVTDHTQGNWNGVVGKIEVRKVFPSRVAHLQLYPRTDGTVQVVVEGQVAPDAREAGLRLEISPRVESNKTLFLPSQVIEKQADGRFRAERVAKVEDVRLWSEFSPALYEARAFLGWGDDTEDVKSTTFGFREVGTKDGRITVNGRKIFLRGTLECAIFPLTGHPPTDVDAWRRIIRICQAHGLNHIRFHSWCPPEAAFIAADELGFYYQVEASSWPNQGAEIGSGTQLDEWLENESKRMLAVYGNHPSFLLMTHGNEPAGKNHHQWLMDWVARRKAEDPRRLYTTGANWPILPGSDYQNWGKPRIQAWGGGLKSIINAQPPRTDFDWSEIIAPHGDTPVVSHEIGQWCVYPNFREIDKYTGHFKARNFEIFRETARRNGLLDQAGDFLMASGKLQTLAYKHDIEAAMRTNPFGGFQLLDLHDFPGQGTALVGVLDAFWDSKGYVTPEEFRRFSGPVVPLIRTGKMVLTSDQALQADVELCHFGPADFKQLSTAWRLVTTAGEAVAEGALPAMDLPTGELHKLGRIEVPLSKVKAPAKLRLEVFSKSGGFSNDWDFFVYPAEVSLKQSNVLITRDLTEALSALGEGREVLWCPSADTVVDDPQRPLIAGFSPIFWNTAWTNWQAPHTLGILCDPKHPALSAFPTDFHSNWQWWELQQGARPFILTEKNGMKPIVQVIDDWFTNRKLGYVFEARVGKGRLLASSIDLIGIKDRPVATQLRSSILEYMNGESFRPTRELDAASLQSLNRAP
jgi:hypothetical protein